jgi:hypothetical protein
MTILSFTPTQDSIPELEVTTMALAGPSAVMNSQAQALLNRMEYYNANKNTSVFNVQSGVSYSPILTDIGLTVKLTSAAAVIVTVSNDSLTLFPTGTNIDFIQDGIGKVTFVAASGVTIKSIAGWLVMSGQYSGVTLRKETTNSWYLIGSLSPS